MGGIAAVVGLVSALLSLNLSQMALFGEGSVGYLAAWTCTFVGIRRSLLATFVLHDSTLSVGRVTRLIAFVRMSTRQP